MYDEILVPTDGSEAGEEALEHALDLASKYDARVHALYVVDTSAYAALEGAGTSVVATLRERGEAAVDEVVETAEAAGVAAVGAVRDGSPHRNILSYTGENDIDLVVMATHGRRGLDRYLLGSVTERVVRSSTVPVLTVRIGGKAEADAERDRAEEQVEDGA